MNLDEYLNDGPGELAYYRAIRLVFQVALDDPDAIARALDVITRTEVSE